MGIKSLDFLRKEDDLQVDVYLANEKNYEVLVLLKTGSKQHNIKLCSEALKQNWKMTTEGLVTNEGIINKEKEILEKVFEKWISPENRE